MGFDVRVKASLFFATGLPADITVDVLIFGMTFYLSLADSFVRSCKGPKIETELYPIGMVKLNVPNILPGLPP